MANIMLKLDSSLFAVSQTELGLQVQLSQLSVSTTVFVSVSLYIQRLVCVSVFVCVFLTWLLSTLQPCFRANVLPREMLMAQPTMAIAKASPITSENNVTSGARGALSLEQQEKISVSGFYHCYPVHTDTQASLQKPQGVRAVHIFPEYLKKGKKKKKGNQQAPCQLLR